VLLHFGYFSQSTLRLRNNTAKEILTSYAVWDNDSGCWVISGLYKIKPNKYQYFDLGNYHGLAFLQTSNQRSLIPSEQLGMCKSLLKG
jgi:hypothetical protein